MGLTWLKWEFPLLYLCGDTSVLFSCDQSGYFSLIASSIFQPWGNLRIWCVLAVLDPDTDDEIFSPRNEKLQPSSSYRLHFLNIWSCVAPGFTVRHGVTIPASFLKIQLLGATRSSASDFGVVWSSDQRGRKCSVDVQKCLSLGIAGEGFSRAGFYFVRVFFFFLPSLLLHVYQTYGKKWKTKRFEG